MAKKTQNAVLNADGSRFQIGSDPQSVVQFLSLFNALPARPRSGYDKYFNDDGPVNPISIEGLSPQGVVKMLAKLYEVAYQIIGRGGDDAAAMETALQGVEGYKALAPEFVAKRKRQAQLMTALAALGDTPEAATIRARAAAEGIDLPETGAVVATQANAEEAAAQVPEATVTESTGDNEDAEVNADDAANVE